MATLDIIKQLLQDKVTSEITLDKTMEDLGIDSLTLVEVIVELEERLEIEFEDDDLINLKTIKDVVELIDSKL